MDNKQKKLMVVQVAGLGCDFLHRCGVKDISGLTVQSTRSVFPALTSPVQASFRTAMPPCDHGMVSNAVWVEQLSRPMFWQQSSQLVNGPRIWQQFRRDGRRVGMMFWQQSLGEDVDLLLSPAPIHKHSGGMIQDCYSKPAGLYDRLCKEIGRKFNLMRYWGPLASAKVGDWIASATEVVLQDTELAPELFFVYLPSLDYDLQRYGPGHIKTRRALQQTRKQLDRIISKARQCDYDAVIYGDYAITDTPAGALFPNKVLYEAGMFSVREVKSMQYPDFYASRVFAVVDHQIAHVYIKDANDIQAVSDLLGGIDGIDMVMDRRLLADHKLDHANTGQLVLVADSHHWLAYPWWSKPDKAPDYARAIDIHNKPGYDPCELFFGWPPGVSVNTARISASHGRVDERTDVAWMATFDLGGKPGSLIDLSLQIKNWLNETQ